MGVRPTGFSSLLLTAALLVAGLPAASRASAVAATDVRSGRDWMPDVAARIKALREHAKRVDDDARLRRSDDPRSSQWWRMVAAAPLASRRP